jgi:hypothetical protein
MKFYGKECVVSLMLKKSSSFSRMHQLVSKRVRFCQNRHVLDMTFSNPAAKFYKNHENFAYLGFSYSSTK